MMQRDVPEVLELIEDFMVRLYGVDYDRTEAFQLMHGACYNEDNLCLVSAKNKKIGGVFLGNAHYIPFTGKNAMREVLWYAVDGSGFNLLSTAIEWSKDYNVDEFYHTIVEPVDDKHIKILQRVGMTPVERSFVMKL